MVVAFKCEKNMKILRMHFNALERNRTLDEIELR